MKLEDMDKLYGYTVKLWESVEEEQYNFEQKTQAELQEANMKISVLQSEVASEKVINQDLLKRLESKVQEIGSLNGKLSTANNLAGRLNQELLESQKKQKEFKTQLLRIVGIIG